MDNREDRHSSHTLASLSIGHPEVVLILDVGQLMSHTRDLTRMIVTDLLFWNSVDS